MNRLKMWGYYRISRVFHDDDGGSRRGIVPVDL